MGNNIYEEVKTRFLEIRQIIIDGNNLTYDDFVYYVECEIADLRYQDAMGTLDRLLVKKTIGKTYSLCTR